jgi:hypothetical protein
LQVWLNGVTSVTKVSREEKRGSAFYRIRISTKIHRTKYNIMNQPRKPNYSAFVAM